MKSAVTLTVWTGALSERAGTVRGMDEIEALGRVIDARREAAGISVDELARRTLIPRVSLIRYLASGDVKSSALCRIAVELDTTPGALWAEVETAVA